MKIHHIGYLVKAIDKSIASFQVLGYKVTKETVWDNIRQAYICFLENDGYCVELISPGKESRLYPLLKQFNNSPYHMCYKVDNLEQAIEELKKFKFMMFLEPECAPAISGTAKVAFLINARAGIIELVEEK